MIPLKVMGVFEGILNVLDSCDLPGAWRGIVCGVGRGIRLNVAMLRWMTLLYGVERSRKLVIIIFSWVLR